MYVADNPQDFVEAGLLVQHMCDAVDLNLGCPQASAARDHFGACLMDEPELVRSIVALAAKTLSVPVTCKIRVFEVCTWAFFRYVHGHF